MNEFRIVLGAELVRKLRSRVFWFSTLGGLLAIALLIEVPFFFARVARSSSSDLILAGSPALRDSAAALLARSKEFRVVARVDALPAHVTPAYLDAHEHAGAAVTVAMAGGRLRLDVYPRDLSSFDEISFRPLVPLAVSAATGLPTQRVERAANFEKHVHPLDEKFKDTQSAALAHAVAFGMVFLLYIAIILGSQSVMSAVAEEKTSRIAEILIATIEPVTLLYGKTIAAALVAFAQVGLWMLTAAVLLPLSVHSFVRTSAASDGAKTPHILASLSPSLVALFLAFFVLGYLQYASIYAAAASLVSRTEELGIVTTPVIMPVVGAFFVAQYALVDPNAPLVVTCSFVPFLSPFVAFTRLAITAMPAWQIALALAINLATVALCYWAAGKIYRIGMLLYGKPPSIRQIIAALRA